MELTKDSLIESLQFWSADDFKKLQTRLTKTANSISRDALGRKVQPFLSEKEITTLRDAVAILSGIKGKVEHAKESKLRQEKKLAAHLARCEAQRKALINKWLPLPVEPENYVHILLWRLAIGQYLQKYLRVGYVPENRFVIDDLRWAFDEKKHHLTLKGAIRDFRREVHEIIARHLWSYNKTPEESAISELIRVFESEWKVAVQNAYSTTIAPVKDEVSALQFVSRCNAAMRD